MRVTTRGCLLTLLALSTTTVLAQDYPARPIRIVVPTAAAGSPDVLARLLAERLRERWGQPVVIENRAGAGQIIGAEIVAKAPADGYTLLLPTGTYTTSVAIRTTLPFDPARDLTGVAMVGQGPLMLVVHPSLPARSMKELIALAKARPGDLNYATAGTGSIIHFAAEALAVAAGIDITHVPYKGGAPQVAALLGGETQASFATIGTVISQIQAGKLRPLGVGSSARAKALPGVPTISEAGLPGYDMNPWIGVFAPAGTPRAIIDRLNAEMNQALSIPEVMSTLAKQALDPAPTTVDEFNRILRVDFEKYGKLIALTGAKIE